MISDKELEKNCKRYEQTTIRLEKMGITNKYDAIIELAKEIDMYRQKLRNYEMSMKMDKSIKELDESLAEAAGGYFDSGVLTVGEEAIHIPIIDALPDDLIDRLVSVTVDLDGRISLYFSEVKNGNDK